MGAWVCRLGSMLLVAVCLPVGLVGAEKTGDTRVDLRVVKNDELEKSISGHKGKVVIVDFWADT
jgi:hypothetical protein